MTFAELLRRDVSVTDDQARQLEAHYELMVKWNRTINLTRVTNLAAAARKHYAESIFLSSAIPVDVKTVADIGSGAGMPGIPLAIVRPELLVTLVESDQRKAVFLRESTAALPNVALVNARAEDLQITFDSIVSRAVSPNEVAKLVPRVAPQAWMLLSSREAHPGWSTARIVPWDVGSAVMFHVKH